MRHSEVSPISCRVRAVKSVLLLLLLELSFVSPRAQIRQALSPAEMVNQMVQAESSAKANRPHFLYRRKERSIRTKGHLWDELVVETGEGRMRRLIAVDGKPLSSSEQSAEDNRITYLTNHPADFRREAQGRKDDEARMADLLENSPDSFCSKPPARRVIVPVSLSRLIHNFRKRAFRTG